MRVRALLLLLLSSATVSGCGDSRPAPSADYTVADSAGVRVTSNGPLSMLPEAARVARRPLFRLGWEDDEPFFEDLWVGAFTPRGTILLGDQVHPGVWEVDLGGEVLQAWTRRGEGPGEFGWVSVVLPGPDSTYVMDGRSRRVSVFADGAFRRSFPMPTRTGQIFLRSSDGKFLVRATGAPRVTDPSKRWLQGGVYRMSGQGEVIDTVLVFDISTAWPAPRTFDPFGPTGEVAASSARLVEVRTDLPEVRWYDFEGELRQIARWEAEPQPVTEETWEALAASYAGLSSGEVDPSRADEYVAGLRATASTVLPLTGWRLRTDDRDRVWLTEFTVPWQEPTRCYVVDPDGRFLGFVDLPEGFTLLAVSAHAILGVEKDEWDVQAAVVYPLDWER